MRAFSVFVLSVLGQALTASAYCCSSPAVCDDGTKSDIWSCCAYGSCNIFCCNCDGGCRKKATKRSWSDWESGPGAVTQPGSACEAAPLCGLTDTDAQCVINKLDALDGNLDGRVSLAEILANPDVVRPGVSAMVLDVDIRNGKLTEIFNIYDTNKDGYLDFEEANTKHTINLGGL